MTTINTPLFRRADWSSVKMPLTDEEVRAWVSNLRSGEYEQGQEQLCNEGAYCCLGVLAKTQGLFGELFKPSDGTLRIYDSEKAGEYKLPEFIQDRLAELNDHNTSFNRIADIIEAGFFTEFEGQDIPDILEIEGFDIDFAEAYGFEGFDIDYDE